MRALVSLLLCCVGVNLGNLPGCQGTSKDIQLTTDQPQVKINVGLNATLVWRYKVVSNIHYETVWGISDGSNLKRNGVLFSQDKTQKRPRMSSVPLAYAGRVHIVDQASLVITDARLSDEGFYTCEIRTMFKTVKKTIELRVVDPPRITKRPKDNLSVRESDQLNVRCEASGFPVPKITWMKLQNNRQISRGNSLMFHSVRREDSGLYSCVADNGEGKPAIAYVRINVKYAPKINETVTKERVAGFRDQTVVLHCVADGNPVPQYQWTTPSGRLLPTREGNGTVSITLSGDKPFGAYVCLVNNAYGTDTTAVTVEEVVQPSPVLHFTVQGATPHSVSLRWTRPGEFGNGKIVEYVLKYSANEKVWRTLIIKPEETSYVVTGLLAYTEYTFKIQAANEYFSSDAVKLVKKTTEAAPGAPENFAIKVINSTAVRLSWSEPKRPNGRIVHYKITYRVVTTIPQYPDRVSTPHNVTSYTLGGLKPFTNYSIDVMASNAIPGGNKSVLFITTKQQAPGIPRDLSLNYTGGQIIQLTWRRPRILNGIVVGLRVRLEWWRNDTLQSHTDVVEERAVGKKVRAKRATSRDGHEILVEQVKPWRSVVIKNLMFFSMYRLSVSEGTGSEQVLWGPYTNVTRAVLTPEGAPSNPMNVKISQVTISSLSVAWHRPLFPNGKIRMYTVKYKNSSGEFYEKISRDLNNQSFLIILSNLKPLALYKVTVQAYTLYPGELSDAVPAKTEKLGTTSQRTGEINSASLLGGVSTGVVLLAFIIIGLVILYRNRRKKRDSAELQKGRYAVANSNDSGIGEKDSMEGGMRYLHTTPRRSSEGSGSWV